MKKIVTTVVLATLIIACNNAADSSSSESGTVTDTLNKVDTIIPPPVPPVTLDTPVSSSDSAKVKKAMKK